MPVRAVERRKHRKISVGDMRSHVMVQRTVTLPGAGGASAKQFVDVFPKWMKMETVTERQGAGGRSEFNGRNTGPAPTHRFTCRFSREVKAQRFLWLDGERFEILSAEDVDGRKEYQKILARFTGRDDREASEA